jgi:hypothetical protein
MSVLLINLPSEIEHYFNKPKANRIDKDEYFILDETQEDYMKLNI